MSSLLGPYGAITIMISKLQNIVAPAKGCPKFDYISFKQIFQDYFDKIASKYLYINFSYLSASTFSCTFFGTGSYFSKNIE